MSLRNVCLPSIMVIVLVVGIHAEDDGSSVYKHFPGSLGAAYTTSCGSGLSWQEYYGDLSIALIGGINYNPSKPVSMYLYENLLLDYNVQVLVGYLISNDSWRDLFQHNFQAALYLAHRGIQVCTVDYLPASAGMDYTAVVTPGLYKPLFFVGMGVTSEFTVLGHLSQTLEFLYVYNVIATSFGPHFGTSYRFRY